MVYGIGARLPRRFRTASIEYYQHRGTYVNLSTEIAYSLNLQSCGDQYEWTLHVRPGAFAEEDLPWISRTEHASCGLELLINQTGVAFRRAAVACGLDKPIAWPGPAKDAQPETRTYTFQKQIVNERCARFINTLTAYLPELRDVSSV